MAFTAFRPTAAHALGELLRASRSATASLERPTTLLAFDVGERRVGVAVSHSELLGVLPHRTLQRRPGREFEFAEEVRSLVRETQASALVVGWPLELSGVAGRQCGRVARLLSSIAMLGSLDDLGLRDEARAAAAAGPSRNRNDKRPTLPVALWDERYSTREVMEGIGEDISLSKKRRVVDPLAAALIMTSFLGGAVEAGGCDFLEEELEEEEEEEELDGEWDRDWSRH